MASRISNHNDATNVTVSTAAAKKKKKSGFSSILAAFCGGSKGHEPEAMSSSRTTRPAAVAPVATVSPIDKRNDPSPTQPSSNDVGKGVEAVPTMPNHLAGVSNENQTAIPLSSIKPVGAPDIVTTSTAQNEIPNTKVQSTFPQSTEDAGTVALSERDSNDTPVARPTVALAPPLPATVSSSERIERESPAQELGMTDVEMGREPLERDHQDEVIVPPHHSISEGVKIPLEETEGLLSAAVQPPGSGPHSLATHVSNHHGGASGSGVGATVVDTATIDGRISPDTTTDLQPAQDTAAPMYPAVDSSLLDDMDEEDRLIAQGGIGIPSGPDGLPAPLLPPVALEHKGRKCLVLDLDETLLHSSFKMISSADYIVPVEIESQTHNVYVVKRPGVDNFLLQMGKIYEIVVFTASLSKYADPVLDILDIHSVVKHRLFRESCYNHKGNYVKDLSQLGREMSKSIIIDNSPASYIFHPNNAVPVSTWFNDPHDTELTDLCPFLTDLETVEDIRGVLDGSL